MPPWDIGGVDFESIALAHLSCLRQYSQLEMRLLEPLAESGPVHVESDGIRVTPLGWPVVRSVAMPLDRHLQSDKATAGFSCIV